MFGGEYDINLDVNPDYTRQQGQLADAVDETQRALLALQTDTTGSLALSNTGNNVTLAFSGGALTANFTGGSYTLISGLGTMATKNVAAAVADLGTTASAGYVQAELQAVIDKLDELLGALRTAVHINT